MTVMKEGQDGMLRPSRRIQLLPGTKRGASAIWDDYNQIFIEDSQDERASKLEQWIAKNVGEAIMQRYPNREWKVIVDLVGQMLIVACDSVSNTKGYHIKMGHRNLHELISRALEGAGEILERHNVSRARKFDADIIETLPRDRHDNVIAPDASPEPI